MDTSAPKAGQTKREMASCARLTRHAASGFGVARSAVALSAPRLVNLIGKLVLGVPGTAPPAKKTVVVGHERKTSKRIGGTDESTLFFDEKTATFEIITVPNPDAEGLAPDR